MAKHDEREFDHEPVTKEPSMAEVVTMLAQIQAENIKLQREQLEQQRVIAEKNREIQHAQLEQTRKKSLTSPPKISAFNPRGEKDFPMPRLKCEIFAPWKMTPEIHSLDREEVELFNLLEPGEYPNIHRMDQSEITVCVVAVRNSETGQLERLSLMGPKDEQGQHGSLFPKEQKQNFPPLRQLLRELLGEKADSVQTMKAEIAQIARGELPVSVGA